MNISPIDFVADHALAVSQLVELAIHESRVTGSLVRVECIGACAARAVHAELLVECDSDSGSVYRGADLSGALWAVEVV